MKNLMILAALVSFTLFSCTKEEVKVNQYDSSKAIQSKMDFYAYAKNGGFPVSKLSQDAINHFAESLIFDENNFARGFNIEYLVKELNEAEYNIFFQQVLKENPPFYGEKVYRDLKNLGNPFYNPGLPNGGDNWIIHYSPRVSGNNWRCVYSHMDICRNPASFNWTGGGSNGG